MNKLPTIAKILLVTIGVVLWAGSNFLGILIIIAGFGIHTFQIFKAKGKDETKAIIKKTLKKSLYPFLGILSAIIIGAILILISGGNPIASYGALFWGGFVNNWHVTLLNAAPLIFTGLSIAIAFNAGLFNIGAEGQFYVGSMIACWIAIRFGLPLGLFIPIIFILAALSAALYNVIPATLKVKTGAHEVVTTMMFAHIAAKYSTIFIRNNVGPSSANDYTTEAILENNWLLKLEDIVPGANYRVHVGILIAFGAAIFIWYLLYKTKIGYEIRAVGFNPSAAKTQGISVGKNIMVAMMIAGGLAGIAGVNEVLGLNHKMFENLNAGYGWNGISVALLAGNNPIGVVFAAILWGALDAGGQYMQRRLGTSSAVVEIIKAIILFLMLAKHIYFMAEKFIKTRIKNKKRIISKEVA